MENSQLRDEMAMERTRLANERTLLAYMRTALAFAAAGAAILHFYSGDAGLMIGAGLLLIAGVACIVVGAVRFVVMRRRLRQ